MKRFMLANLVFLFSIGAFAGTRDFRINRNAVENGYAVAWGVPGQKTDFEAIEKDDKKVDEFINTAVVHNYLVDIEQDRILLDLTGNNPDSEVDYRLGDYHIGNHFNIALSNIEIDNKGGFDREAIAVIENNKWSNQLTKIVILNREGKETTVSAELPDAQEKIMTAIREKLTKEQWKKLSEGAINISLETSFLEKYGYVNVVRLDSAIPKSDDPGVAVSAYVQLSIKDGKTEAKVLSLKYKKVTF